ncbi:NHL repeat-containing protein 2 isoform X2 [Eurytemora carolleeae]|uniref:NHL repeat-containing protein 2 isoform X2 n=1 Tax=Eurytemora carolleeae TaxID=1294199 RepID=UPI000C75EBE1|nr:NHL repeat-containing protein 2 isoform X2 [Eurytemora carolleeae]|eukprot:XP_023336064.1 NHL repeat-containing protein 2-like isoform X2 [Eurytemora affinis]
MSSQTPVQLPSRRMCDDEELCMPLYWRCQDLQNKLLEEQDQGARSQIIIKSIQENLAEFSKHSEKIVFSPDLSWFNTPQPLKRQSFDGLITVIDFFTYCCINCMHILPDLETVESMFPTEVCVVGVHSAKFENEKSETQIEHAIQRYNIEHPVCNDKSLQLWKSLGVTCWPTLLILSPTGVPIQVLMGEGHSGFLIEFLNTAIKYFKGTGELVEGRIPRSINSKVGGFNLKYPGKITLHNQNLVVSDSGNNRILILNLESGCSATVLHTIGSGVRGRQDGEYGSSSFNNPQGLCYIGEDLLMVSDTDNHLLRMINLKTQRVSTVGGTGVQGVDKEGGKTGLEQEISSPWDIVKINEGAVAVAMAGTHQIWMYCLAEVGWWKGLVYPAGTLVRIAGSGAEENRNNSYPAKAGFAQPSGLSLDQSQGTLFIADSESSTVRRMDLKDGCVKNVVGGERDPMNLFGFGDIDASGVNAKLQHPLAVAWNPIRKELYVADSYNHKIKKISGPKNDCISLVGKDPGDQIGDSILARLCEPGGISVSEDGSLLYIADTNNHAVKALNLDTLTLHRVGIKFPESTEKFDNVIEHKIEGNFSDGLELNASLEHLEYKLNADGTSSWRLESTDQGWKYPNSGELSSSNLSIPLVWDGADTAVTLNLNLKIYLCSKNDGVCLAKNILHKLEIRNISGGNHVSVVSLGSLLTY